MLDLLQRLNRQFEPWTNDSLNIDKAQDFCLTAWSLANWGFYDKNPDLVGKKENKNAHHRKRAYRIDIFQKRKNLEIMADIANDKAFQS